MANSDDESSSAIAVFATWTELGYHIFFLKAKLLEAGNHL